MAELKTRQNEQSVNDFLASIADEKRRQDCYTVMELMKRITGNEPKMWGNSLVGFGSYHYKYASGREGDWFLTGFAPRKQNLTLYIIAGFHRYEELLKKLGTYKTGKSCLYVKKLEDINRDILTELIEQSVEHLRESTVV